MSKRLQNSGAFPFSSSTARRGPLLTDEQARHLLNTASDARYQRRAPPPIRLLAYPLNFVKAIGLISVDIISSLLVVVRTAPASEDGV